MLYPLSHRRVRHEPDNMYHTIKCCNVQEEFRNIRPKVIREPRRLVEERLKSQESPAGAGGVFRSRQRAAGQGKRRDSG